MTHRVSFSVLTLPHSSSKWNIVSSYLALRRTVFVEKMNWSLDGNDEFEYEEYDAGPHAHYVIGHVGDNAVAGARLVRCDTETGVGDDARSYMIRDAALGRINLPRELWVDSAPPTEPTCWELTRLVSGTRDSEIAKGVLEVAFEYMGRQGGQRCICLSAPPMLRLVRRYGYRVTPRSAILGNRDGRFMTFECDLTQRVVPAPISNSGIRS